MVNVLLFEVPPRLTTVTLTDPLAIDGTITVILVFVLVSRVVADVELNLTVAAARLVPVIVSVEPADPDVGLIVEM